MKPQDESTFNKTCTPITYTVDDAETSIILLTSKETDVVGKALCNLCRGIEADENLPGFLMTKGVFQKLTDLLKTRQGLVNLKYSLKLFGLLVTVPIDGIQKLDKKSLYDSVPRIIRFYFSSDDDFVREACSLILNKTISFNPVLSNYVCFKKIMRRIVRLLETSVDPDVLKNSLDLLQLLMNCEEFLEQLVNIKRKHLNVFLCLLECGVDAIADTSMDILHQISALRAAGVSNKMARGETLTKMVSIIINKNKKYVEKATDIISNCVRNKQAAIHFSLTKHFAALLDYLKNCDNNSLLRLLPIFGVVTKVSSIREKMYLLSAEDTLFQFLKYRHESIVLCMCQIIANFTAHKDCCKKILSPAVVKYLVEVLKSFPMDPYKAIAMKALYSFMKCEPTALGYLPKSGALREIQRIFLDNEESYPKRFYEMVTEMTGAMAYSMLIKQLDTKRMCEKILDLLRKHHSSTKDLLKMVSMMMDSTAFREQFVTSCGPAYFLSTIQKDAFDNTYQLNLDIIQNLVRYEDMALQFLDLGLMSLMIKLINKGSRKSEVYKDIVDNLYDSCLTLKLFDKKRLDDEDTISGLFFLFQEYSIDPKSTEFKPIYIINIERSEDDDDQSNGNVNISSSIIIKTVRNHSSATRAILTYALNDYDFDQDFLPKDPYLWQYVVDLREELRSFPLSLEDQIKKVALFVDRQLSGIVFTDSEEEKLVYFKRHINEICENLGHRFIPLGFLRMGYVCEKSFMFKVLCDIVCIPSSFYHEKNGIFWNSVSLNKEDTDVYIVDFKNKIGSLIPRRSSLGVKYLEI